MTKKIMYFTAKWCGPCQSFRPIVQQVIKEGADIIMIDADSSNGLVERLGVSSIPSILVVDENYNVVKRHSGVMTKEQLKNFIV